MEARSVAIVLLLALSAAGQDRRTARRKPDNRPECARGAICFAGEVSAGQEFRRRLDSGIEFVLAPGWHIQVVPARPEGECSELAWVATPPFRGRNGLHIDMSYGWTASEEVSDSPREFRFVTNCADYRAEYERVAAVLWPYNVSEQKHDAAVARLGTSPTGAGQLWITDSRIAGGRIEWIKFTVELRLPRDKNRR